MVKGQGGVEDGHRGQSPLEGWLTSFILSSE